MLAGVSALYVAVTLATVAHGGDLDPPGLPGPTMLGLDELPPAWHQLLSATGRSGDPCDSPRFTCVMGGSAVLDHETGLVWERTPTLGTQVTWVTAVNSCFLHNTGGRYGWRLPELVEMKTLLGDSTIDRLPSGHPFTGLPMVATSYWTATPSVVDATSAYIFGTSTLGGGISQQPKSGTNGNFWCVRGATGAEF